ncbi:hypothetical protein BCR32DRAFT_326336, partial [Anaeromyces robustus]
MKLLNKFIFLFIISTTTVFSYNLNTLLATKDYHLLNKDIEDEEMIKVIKKCEDGLAKYEKCLYGSDKFTRDNIDDFCNTFNSERCQNFYKSPIETIPICKEIPKELQNTFNEMFSLSYPSMKFFCQKDENGNLCPMVEYELSESNNKYDDTKSNKNKNNKKRVSEEIVLLMKVVKQTCKSEICKEAALNLYNTLNESMDIEDAILSEDHKAMENNKIIMNILRVLKSKNCSR